MPRPVSPFFILPLTHLTRDNSSEQILHSILAIMMLSMMLHRSGQPGWRHAGTESWSRPSKYTRHWSVVHSQLPSCSSFVSLSMFPSHIYTRKSQRAETRVMPLLPLHSHNTPLRTGVLESDSGRSGDTGSIRRCGRQDGAEVGREKGLFCAPVRLLLTQRQSSFSVLTVIFFCPNF